MHRVVVGLSGGVDSSIAAYILKKQGFDVLTLFMINWHDTTGLLHGDCPSNDDLIFAELTARKLGLPFRVIDLSSEYKKRVVNYLFYEYENGRTPNPDVLCNREIKFDAFVNEAMNMGADFVATGHYCRKESLNQDGKIIYRLLAGKDKNKDQSYFLCQLSQDQLRPALFPVGDLDKTEVRRIAKEIDLPTAHRKDSQGICFVGKVDLPVFLQQKIKPKTGDIIEINPQFIGYNDKIQSRETYTDEALASLASPYYYSSDHGAKIGEHNGAHYYTIGQRKGLNIGGKSEPVFVIATDILNNIVYTGMGKDHPGLYRPALFIQKDDMHWIRPDMELPYGGSARFLFRIRYRQPLQGGMLFIREKGTYVVFDNLQRGITPGQFAVWYAGEEVIGSGVIE